MFQSAESIHCKWSLLMYSGLLQDTEWYSGCYHTHTHTPHTHTHTHTYRDYAVGWLYKHFCFFPPCTKWSTIAPQTVRCQHEIPSFASAFKTAWLLVMPATHQCLHKIHFSHGGPETLLNTAPILLSTVRQSHDKSLWLNSASLPASQ